MHAQYHCQMIAILLKMYGRFSSSQYSVDLAIPGKSKHVISTFYQSFFVESIVFLSKPGISLSLLACLVCMHRTSDKQAVSSSVVVTRILVGVLYRPVHM